jgi:hypothetical protein
VMIAITIVWRLDGVTAATAETSQLSFITHYDPRLRPVGVTLSPIAIESPEHILSQLAIGTPTRRASPLRANLLLNAPGIVPAGEYELRPKNRAASIGTVRLVMEKSTLRSWNLASDLRDGALTFELPVNIWALSVEGDREAATTGGFELVPKRIVSGSARLSNADARRVARYGPAFVFFFDAHAYPEQPGIWIRGDAASTIAVMPAERGTPVQLVVRNAPVKNTVTIEVNGQRQVLELQPGEQRVVPVQLPGEQLAALLEFRTETGFRPSEVEPGSTDNRFLGAWIEVK